MAEETTPKVAPKVAPPAPKLARTQLGDWLVRATMMIAGLGFVIGFFLPWLSFGKVASLSGFTLFLTKGDAVEAVSGPHRAMLIFVPVFGAILCISAVYGYRLASWFAVFAGTLVILAGFATLVIAFFDTTGVGMWLVTASALISLGIGVLSVGRQGSATPPPPKDEPPPEPLPEAAPEADAAKSYDARLR